MFVQAGKSWTKRVAEALNLDPKTVRSIRVTIEPNSIVTAFVERYVDGEEMEALTKLLGEVQPQIVEMKSE